MGGAGTLPLRGAGFRKHSENGGWVGLTANAAALIIAEMRFVGGGGKTPLLAAVLLLLFPVGHAHADVPAASNAAEEAASDTAEEDTPSAAEIAALRERGHAAMKTGRPADALAAYEAVYAATKDPPMLYNMGRAQQALTNYAHASELLAQFKKEAPAELVAKVPVDKLLAELAARVHTLTLVCEEAGAEVRLNDKVVGTTPFAEPLRINAGPTEIEVRKEEFVPFKRRLDLRGGETSALHVELVRADLSGILLVRSPQAGAAVSIDGRSVGQVPVEVPLLAGTHEVLVTKDGFTPSKSRVVVVTGQRREVSIDLARTPGLLTRWWFWAGVGAVVAGGVASYVMLTTEKDPPTGSIAPGQTVLGLSY